MIHRRNRQILLVVTGVLVLALFSTARAEPGQAKRHRRFAQTATAFLQGAAPGARALFAERSSHVSLIALGAVLQRTDVSRDLLTKTMNNPYTFAKRDGLEPMILPAVRALARLGNIAGAHEVLERSAKSINSEGMTRGALFELVAGSAVKRMGYKLDGLSFQLGKYETDGIVNKASARPTLVNMKSISSQGVLKGVVKKAAYQLFNRNGSRMKRPPKQRNPALLVIEQMPGVQLSKANWATIATRSGGDLTVIAVNPSTARGRALFRRGVNQLAKRDRRSKPRQR